MFSSNVHEKNPKEGKHTQRFHSVSNDGDDVLFIEIKSTNNSSSSRCDSIVSVPAAVSQQSGAEQTE